MSDTPKTADLKSPAELQKRLLHLERDQDRYAADRSRVEQRLESVRAALAVAPQVEQAPAAPQRKTLRSARRPASGKPDAGSTGSPRPADPAAGSSNV